MPDQPTFLLDSNVFISAYRMRYYSFEFCPGFWEAVINYHRQGIMHSIDKVETELLGNDELSDWIRDSIPSGFFRSSLNDPRVVSKYQPIHRWAKQKYTAPAVSKFTNGADGWLVACAKAHGATVITHEKPKPNSSTEIKIPDACTQFGVKYGDTFDMLRKLGIKFILPPPQQQR